MHTDPRSKDKPGIHQDDEDVKAVTAMPASDVTAP